MSARAPVKFSPRAVGPTPGRREGGSGASDQVYCEIRHPRHWPVPVWGLASPPLFSSEDREGAQRRRLSLQYLKCLHRMRGRRERGGGEEVDLRHGG